MKFDVNVATGREEENYILEVTTDLKVLSNGNNVLRLETKFAGCFSVIEGKENMSIISYIYYYSKGWN